MKNNEFPANRLKAISCLLSCDSIELAAKKAGVSRGTIYNWLKDEHFKARLEQERQTLFEEGLNLILGATKKAAQTLTQLLRSKNQTTQRLAAKEIISVSLKVAELRDLQDRVEKIEEQLASSMSLYNARRY